MSTTDPHTTMPPHAASADGTSNAGSKTHAPKVSIDESHLSTLYANFCRVTGTPEELLVDFGMNAQPMAGQGTDRIALSQRVVMNFYTAKRLLAAMNMAIQRHEAMFGELETNVQKRVRKPAETPQS